MWRASVLGVLLLTSLGASLSAGEDLAQLVASNPVWILDGLKWEKDPGARNQSFAAGSVLYFSSNGEFGMFSGIILRHGGRMAFGTGEGEVVHVGRWKASDGAIQIDYRLMLLEKVLRPKGEKPPEVPGPLLHAEIRPKQKLGGKDRNKTFFEIEERRYVSISRLEVSELVEQLHHLSETQPPQS